MEGTTSTADNGDFGTAPSEFCGYCGVALEGDRCKVVIKSDKQTNAKISGCSCPCFDSNHNYKSSLSSSTKTPCTNVPVLCQESPCKGLSTVFFRYNITSHFRSAHDNLDVTEIISTAMAKLTMAGPCRRWTSQASSRCSTKRGTRRRMRWCWPSTTSGARWWQSSRARKYVRLRLWRFQRRLGRVRQRRQRKETPSSAHRTSTQEAASSRRQL